MCIHHLWIVLGNGFLVLTFKKAILKAGMIVHDVGVLVAGGLTVDYAKIMTDGPEVQEGGAMTAIFCKSGWSGDC
jgi:hypothetical protein